MFSTNAITSDSLSFAMDVSGTVVNPTKVDALNLRSPEIGIC
jgi:hypothetical protein